VIVEDRRIEVAVLKSEMNNLTSIVLDIKKALLESTQTRQVQHTEVVRQLATIEEKQENFNKYQETCEVDRKDINSRLIKIENTQAVHKRVGAAFMLAITTIGGFFEALGKH